MEELISQASDSFKICTVLILTICASVLVGLVLNKLALSLAELLYHANKKWSSEESRPQVRHYVGTRAVPGHYSNKTSNSQSG